MRHGNSRISRRGDACRDTGHHLERHAGGGEPLRLLASAPEHEWIAALEANHPFPLATESHE